MRIEFSLKFVKLIHVDWLISIDLNHSIDINFYAKFETEIVVSISHSILQFMLTDTKITI